MPNFNFDAMPPEAISKLEALERIDTARGEGVEAVCAFGEYVFGLKAAEHHRAWVEKLLTNDHTVITAPPSSAKTTWVSIIFLSWWIGKNPMTTNAIGSAGDKAANDITKRIAATIELNPRWREVFPDIVPTNGWSSDGYNVMSTNLTEEELKKKPATMSTLDYATELWTMKTGADKNPSFVGGGVGSSRFNGLRISGYLILDDIHDRNSRFSDTVCQDTVSFFSDTADNRLSKDGRLGMVQTRWHRKDSVAKVRSLYYTDGTPIFQVLDHPAIVDGVSYWPEEWPIEKLEGKRQIVGDLEFRLVFLGDTAANEGKLLKAEWLQPFPASNIDRRWPCVYGVDPAFKKLDLVATARKERSRFAVAKYRIAPFGLVIEDILAGHWTETECEAVLQSNALMDAPVRVVIETNGVGDPFYQSLMRRTTLPLTPENAKRDTVARASEMSPDFQFGRVRVSDADTPGLRLFREEWVRIGENNASDDTVSAAYYGWRGASYALWRTETPKEAEDRQRRQKARNPFTAIERAYT